jgi:antitoxin StbD
MGSAQGARSSGTADLGREMFSWLYSALTWELNMETILADVAVSMSEFKKRSVAVIREANHRPVAVLDHNRTAFYVIEPCLFEVMMEELADQDLYCKLASRFADRPRAIEVDIDDI